MPIDPRADRSSRVSSVPPGVARSADDLQQTLDHGLRGFAVLPVPAAAAEGWSIVDGALQHASGGFFSITGVSDPTGSALMLYQPQGAVTGLLSARVEGERWVLLQARAEPGCLGGAQFGPTVQSTPANYLRVHAGLTAPYAGSFIGFDPRIAVVDDTTQLDLGERYVAKTKRSILLEEVETSDPRPGFAWATPAALAESVLRSSFLNLDLRSILAVARWSAHPGEGELTPRSAAVRRSLEAVPRPEVLGQLLARLRGERPPVQRFVALSDLDNWRQTEMGWSEVEPRQGYGVQFFEVTATGRELPTWVQPLVNSSTSGQVVLACRQRAGLLEFFVRPVTERGLVTGAALGPSFVRYPGAPGATPGWLQPPMANIWSETIEGDEGGRFFRDASAYQIVRTDAAPGPEEQDGFWLRLSELKAVLRTSNTCTIQLRGVVSQLLAAD